MADNFNLNVFMVNCQWQMDVGAVECSFVMMWVFYEHVSYFGTEHILNGA